MFRSRRAYSRSNPRVCAVGAVVLAALVLASGPAPAQRKPAPIPDPAAAYDRCMALADTRPVEAQREADAVAHKGRRLCRRAL